MIGSFSTEDDGAVVAPLTFEDAMIEREEERESEKMAAGEVCVDR